MQITFLYTLTHIIVLLRYRTLWNLPFSLGTIRLEQSLCAFRIWRYFSHNSYSIQIWYFSLSTYLSPNQYWEYHVQILYYMQLVLESVKLSHSGRPFFNDEILYILKGSTIISLLDTTCPKKLSQLRVQLALFANFSKTLCNCSLWSFYSSWVH